MSKGGNTYKEQFDRFDRLQNVDQKNLNVDKLDAEDKDSEVEELLATQSRSSYKTNEEGVGFVKSLETDIKPPDYINKSTNLSTLEDTNKADKQPPVVADDRLVQLQMPILSINPITIEQERVDQLNQVDGVDENIITSTQNPAIVNAPIEESNLSASPPKFSPVVSDTETPEVVVTPLGDDDDDDDDEGRCLSARSSAPLTPSSIALRAQACPPITTPCTSEKRR